MSGAPGWFLALAVSAAIAAMAPACATGAPVAASAANTRAMAPSPPRLTLGAPALAADGTVRWGAASLTTPPWAVGLELPPGSPVAALTLWTRLAARDSLLRPYALLQLSRARLAFADTAGADSALAEGGAVPSLWQWPLVQSRAELWRARGQAARADGMLEVTDRSGWPEADRAAWLGLRVRMREEMRDTAQAIAFARQVTRVYPSFGPARVATAALERLLHARRDSLTFEDEMAAAEAERFAGARAAAERRLSRALRHAPATEKSAIATRLAAFRRLLGRHADAERAVAAALAAAGDSGQRADALLERARVMQAKGANDSALALYRRAADAADSTRREEMLLELARETERAARWQDARGALGRVIAAGGRRNAEAGFRIGLLHFIEGGLDSAIGRWEGSDSEAGTFWLAVARRAKARAVADTALRRRLEAAGALGLRTLADRPGYSFYRCAARDTLGMRGWTGTLLTASSTPPAVHSARTLAALGMTTDAANLLSRWNAGDPRAGATAAITAEDRLAAAAAAFAIGSTPLAIGIADRAARALEDAGDRRAWAAQPWLYPPAYDSLANLRPAGLEPAMVMGVMRQESRFDPAARSVSDALGLMQLKLSTARDVMGRLGEKRALTEDLLFEPARNVRYGSAYFAWLAKRFGGSETVALSAYNAGPGTVPAWAPELIARGGEALFAEIASNVTAQDYARKILANRAAYREQRPRSR